MVEFYKDIGWQPRAIAWNERAVVHLIKVEVGADGAATNHPVSKTLCGKKSIYSEVWDLGPDVDCKKCLAIIRREHIKYTYLNNYDSVAYQKR